MTIYHDAYLFRPTEFANRLAPFLEKMSLNRQDTLHELRAAAIGEFDTNPWVRHCAGEYGGWDRTSIIEEPSPVEDTESFTFWIVLLLYSNLAPSDVRLGLGGHFRDVKPALGGLGWPEDETNLVVGGRNFAELFARDTSIGASEEGMRILRSVRPYSTCSSAGWIDRADVERLFDRLTSMHVLAKEPHISKACLEKLGSMLAAANARECGLCLIVSG